MTTRFRLSLRNFPLWCLLCTALLLAGSPGMVSAAEGQQDGKAQADLLAEALGSAIIGPNLAYEEVADFCQARVQPMPELTTVAAWEKWIAGVRQETLEKVVFRGQAAAWRDDEAKVEWLDDIEGGPGYRIRKLRYEALPGLWIPAVLYEPTELKGRVPVVLNVNGHDRKDGKAAAYKQHRCINQAKRGMLSLNLEWYGMGQLATEGFSHYRLNQLDLCGASGVGTFYLAMSRGIDLLLEHEHADPERVAVAGLSGGGWQTIFISSLDTRVTLADPVAGYSSFRTRARFLSDLGDSEQTPVDLAMIADYAVLTAMRAPRPTLLTFNAEDNCCFRASHALPPLLDAAVPVYNLYGKPGNLRSHINVEPGSHNFDRDNRQQLYLMLGDHFFPGKSDYTAREIDSEAELKTAEELHVPLPEENLDLHKLAMKLAETLPENPRFPGTADQHAAWQTGTRTTLREVLRQPRDSKIQATEERSGEIPGAKTVHWKLRVDDNWTVPAVELTPPETQGTTIVLADAGRASVAAQIAALLQEKQRVVAVDPYYLGESKISQRSHLYALLVSSVGDRPLGVQAGQVAAVARWLKSRGDAGPVQVAAYGPRTSLIALTAAGLEAKAIDSLELHESRGSLKQVLEANLTVADEPEQFCFGLLQEFDILKLAELVAPRSVVFVSPSDRVRKELAPLAGLYRTLGADVQPLKNSDE
ncbi:MAG: acetylxylan esterase [Planctomycetaceae bacterium]|nr:acetylxylan esterase [Planctomycetaceae bacterium]